MISPRESQPKEKVGGTQCWVSGKWGGVQKRDRLRLSKSGSRGEGSSKNVAFLV